LREHFAERTTVKSPVSLVEIRIMKAAYYFSAPKSCS